MQQQNKYKKYRNDMRNKLEKKHPGFEFNWKNKLAIWLVIVFIAMSIGYRSKTAEKRYHADIEELLLKRKEAEMPPLREEEYQKERR
jgi:hypothetical protein